MNFLKQLHPTTQQIAFAVGAIVAYLVSKNLLPANDASLVTGALITICTVFTAKQQGAPTGSVSADTLVTKLGTNPLGNWQVISGSTAIATAAQAADSLKAVNDAAPVLPDPKAPPVS